MPGLHLLRARLYDLSASMGLAAARHARWLAAQLEGQTARAAWTAAEQQRLARRSRLVELLKLGHDLLPPDGGWVAHSDLLVRLAERVRSTRPALVVEFGSGLSSVVIARALMLNGTGRLLSFDHDEGFAALTRRRIARVGASHVADVRAVPLIDAARWGYRGYWYDTGALPRAIDLALVDGPPAWRADRAESRGPAGAELLPLLAPGGALWLDDADRAAEQRMLGDWARAFPRFEVRRSSTIKGLAEMQSPARVPAQ